MASFITRVELHDADYQDYINLHLYMRQEGYTTTIRANAGATYHLPPAEYELIDDCTAEQALRRAERAAQKTRKRAAVLVAEYRSCTWSGLQQAQRSPSRAY
jgi:hypothetical protein